MFNVLIDTCIWLKLAEDYKHTPLLQAVEVAVNSNKMRLLIPRRVVEEFKRNRARVLKSSQTSYNSHFQEVRKAVAIVGGDKKRIRAFLEQLNEIGHQLPKVGHPGEATLDAVEALFAKSEIIEPSDAVMLRAGQRALDLRAPCHHTNRNSMGDAVIFETYLEATKSKAAGHRFAFVTDNTNDFSVPNGHKKMPHSDLAGSFTRIRSMYFTNLAECLRKIDSSLVSEVEWFAIQEQPRRISELMEAHEWLFDQIWYNRHKSLAWEIQRGKHKIVTLAEWNRLLKISMKNHSKVTVDTVWKKGQLAASRIEKKRGKENLGPWTHFEWGIINGKLSAIRWVLGDEWDMLDS